MSRTPLRGVRRLFAVFAAVLTTGALTVPAAHADGPQLIITASAGDAKQLGGRSFTVSLSLTNTTDEPYTGVKIWTEHLSGSFVSIQDWAGLGSQDQGVTLDPGATRSFTLTAIVWSWRDGVPSERIHASFSGWDQQPGDYTVPLIDPTTTKGSVSGVVYGDRNDNHQFDAGAFQQAPTAGSRSPTCPRSVMASACTTCRAAGCSTATAPP